MDNKVKITLITTGVLSVLIIAIGLYSTFNPKQIKSELNQINNKQTMQDQGTKAGAGSRAKTNVKSNAYYFPETGVKKAKVDPQGYLKVSDEETDHFLELDIPKPIIDTATNFDQDYVQAPEDTLMMEQEEADQQPQDQDQDF
jgi:hypothetical protein